MVLFQIRQIPLNSRVPDFPYLSVHCAYFCPLYNLTLFSNHAILGLYNKLDLVFTANFTEFVITSLAFFHLGAPYCTPNYTLQTFL